MSRRPSQLAQPPLVLALVICCAAAALAGNGMQIGLPVGAIKNKSGLHLTIDGRGVDANGYRPVKIQVTPWPPKPLVADRQIRVVIKPHTYAGVSSPEVSQVIELPEGSITTTAVFSMPQTSMWHGIEVKTFEGGQLWEDLSNRHLAWSRTNYWDWSEARPTMLFIDSDVPPQPGRDAAINSYRTTGADPAPTHDLPDVRTLVWLFPDPNNTAGSPQAAGTTAPAINAPRATDVMLLSQINDLPRIEMLAPAELPEKWIDLSQYDVAAISLADLQSLAENEPARLAALRDWVSTGPLLVVYGVGNDFEQLTAAEKLLALPPLAPETNRPAGPDNWTLPDRKFKRADLLTPFSPDYGVNARRMSSLRGRKRVTVVRDKELDVESTAEKDDKASKSSGPPPFVFRRAGMGCVAAIASDQPFPGKNTDWIWLFNAVPDNHWKWFRREGFSLHRANDSYWECLIPGVGEAPVVSFLLLVSLFAVVIGPVNYVLLGRSRRLYLLLLTVPAGAAIVTLGLIAYALATDGLGVRLRTRSYVELDQRTGRAVGWARQSYYASITPSQGLKFPNDTTVFPIVAQPRPRGGNRASGTLVWDEGQNLRSGFLASRTATQFMLQRAAASEAKLMVREGQAPGQPPRVENKLDTNALYLLLRDRRGDYFAGKQLVSEAATALAAIEPAAAEKELEQLWKAVELKTPERFHAEFDRNNALTFLFVRNYGWNSGQDASAGQPLMESGLLETNLEEAFQPVKHPLAPGSYMAVVNSSVVVPAGVSRVSEEASLHVIRGRY